VKGKRGENKGEEGEEGAPHESISRDNRKESKLPSRWDVLNYDMPACGMGNSVCVMLWHPLRKNVDRMRMRRRRRRKRALCRPVPLPAPLPVALIAEAQAKNTASKDNQSRYVDEVGRGRPRTSGLPRGSRGFPQRPSSPAWESPPLGPQSASAAVERSLAAGPAAAAAHHLDSRTLLCPKPTPRNLPLGAAAQWISRGRRFQGGSAAMS